MGADSGAAGFSGVAFSAGTFSSGALGAGRVGAGFSARAGASSFSGRAGVSVFGAAGAGVGPGVGTGPGLGPGVVGALVAGALVASPDADSALAGGFSRILRTTGGSMVDDADLTNSPWSFRWASSSLLSTPSSLASS